MKIPDSTRSSLTLRLIKRQRERWPQLKNVAVRFRNNFAYVDGVLPDGEQIPLCRLRYGGYASQWGFAIYLGSSDKYEDSFLPSGSAIGEPAEALDCACGLTSEIPQLGSPPLGHDVPPKSTSRRRPRLPDRRWRLLAGLYAGRR